VLIPKEKSECNENRGGGLDDPRLHLLGKERRKRQGERKEGDSNAHPLPF